MTYPRRYVYQLIHNHTPYTPTPQKSVCLGLMGSLLRVGFEPQDLAYIKPATQCESPQVIVCCGLVCWFIWVAAAHLPTTPWLLSVLVVVDGTGL